MRNATTTNFLDHCERVVEGESRLVDKHVERLIRIGRRYVALEQALRGDPGHEVTAAVVAPTEDRTKSVADWTAMGRALLASTGPFEAGECRVCGCTETTACDAPTDYGSRACGWIEGTGQTLCDAPACAKAGLDSGMLVRVTKVETPTLEAARG